MKRREGFDINLVHFKKDIIFECNMRLQSGGSDSSEAIVLGDFIPFYFGVRMPMLYVIQNEAIIGFVCYNETSKEKLLSFGIDESKIKVIPGAYY